MAKQVDQEARRQRIADAVCRVIARGGLEDASLRHVAAEAGISMGQVQHYFTTKDEMLLSAFNTLSSRVEQRLGQTVGALETPTSTRAVLRALLVAMLAIDEEGRFEAPLWVAFLARAAVRPELAAPMRHAELVEFVTGKLRAAQEARETSELIDPELEASSLFALADGLMIRSLLDPDHASRALAAIDYHLDRIFTAGSSADPPPAHGQP